MWQGVPANTPFGVSTAAGKVIIVVEKITENFVIRVSDATVTYSLIMFDSILFLPNS